MLQGFKGNEFDIPLAVTYSLQRNPIDASQQPMVCFQGALGIADDHPLAVKRVNLDQPSEPLLPLLRTGMTAEGPLLLKREDIGTMDGLLDRVE